MKIKDCKIGTVVKLSKHTDEEALAKGMVGHIEGFEGLRGYAEGSVLELAVLVSWFDIYDSVYYLPEELETIDC